MPGIPFLLFIFICLELWILSFDSLLLLYIYIYIRFLYCGTDLSGIYQRGSMRHDSLDGSLFCQVVKNNCVFGDVNPIVPCRAWTWPQFPFNWANFLVRQFKE